jgi:hypothetical protein
MSVEFVESNFQSSWIQILVIGPENVKLLYDVNLNEKISDLKRRIFKQFGIESNMQKLVNQGRVLRDNRSLQESGIVSLATIEVRVNVLLAH